MNTMSADEVIPGLDVRTTNVLRNLFWGKPFSIDDIAALTEADIIRTPAAGRVTLAKLKDWLALHGKAFASKNASQFVGSPLDVVGAIASLEAQLAEIDQARARVVNAIAVLRGN